MARVLFCWELGNGLAYIEGQAAGAQVIAAAGHEVQLALRDLSHAERLLGGKYRFHQAPTQVIPRGTRLSMPMTFADVLINLGFDDAGAVTARVRAWRNLIDRVRPDIVRCTNAPGALLAARGTGIRSVVIGIGFLVPPDQSPLPLSRSWAKGAMPERMAARERLVLDNMNRGLEAVGAPRVASIGALYADADIRELYTYPELDDYGPREGVKYVGNYQPGMGAAPAWPEGDGKRIFAYLHPYKHIGVVLDALAATGQPVLVYMAHAPEELLRRHAGSKLRIVQEPLDLHQAAALCDLGVSHGGHNIAATFLGAGKPQLIVPALFPERVTAERVQAMGAGLHCRLRSDEITEGLRRLLQDTALADKARAYGAKVAHLTVEQIARATVASIDELAKAGPRK